MKVLYVLNSGFDTPGPSNHLLESVIESLLFNNIKVHIIQKFENGENPAIPKSIAGNLNLTSDLCNVKKTKKSNFIRRYIEDVKYAFSCIKYYIKIRKSIDVIFLQSCNTAFYQMCLLKLIIKKPIIYNVQDIFPKNALMVGMLNDSGLFYRILSCLQKISYRMSDKIITISDDMKQTIISENVSEDKVEVIFNWSYSDDVIEIEDKDNKFIKDNNIINNHFRVVYAGNIGVLQNIDIIIDAAKILYTEKNIKFYIIGDGVKKTEYMAYADLNNLTNIEFFSLQDSEYAPHIYSMGGVNIIPLSKGVIHTALPSKTATCLSCGNPIIACVDRDSKFGMMIDSCDLGSVVDSEDAIGLAKKIKYYSESNFKYKCIDERNLFENYFSKNKNVNKYVNVIKKLKKLK